MARQYNLSSIVDPNRSLSTRERVAAACELCERILDNKQWKNYYLHHNGEQVSSV